MSGPTLDHAARQEIAELLVRYATGIDRRDWTLFATCFTDDCLADYGDIGVWNGAAEITRWMDDMHAPLGHTMHRITNQIITQDGDDVRSRSYVDAIVMGPDNASGVRAVGFYDDVVVNNGGAWQIGQRRFTPVLMQPVENMA
jgi:3-phenylpropionate/cinnamic acid dioxygenase small subunit